jgi:hypothetical protein
MHALEHTFPVKASTLPPVHQARDYNRDRRNNAWDQTMFINFRLFCNKSAACWKLSLVLKIHYLLISYQWQTILIFAY